MIVNRHDHNTFMLNGEPTTYGVGYDLLTHGRYCEDECMLLFHLAQRRRMIRGNGLFLLDIGANIGAVTVPLARKMAEWGYVIAIEPQEWVYYALAGNLALNNLGNARALRLAIGSENGTIRIPLLNPTIPSSFGSLELRPSGVDDDLGQPVDRETGDTIELRTIDSLGFERVDVMKIDVEGMERDVIEGARETILRDHPILFVEQVKCPEGSLNEALRPYGYEKSYVVGMNLLFVHPDDPTAEIIKET